jgi:hypothetical protein
LISKQFFQETARICQELSHFFHNLSFISLLVTERYNTLHHKVNSGIHGTHKICFHLRHSGQLAQKNADGSCNSKGGNVESWGKDTFAAHCKLCCNVRHLRMEGEGKRVLGKAKKSKSIKRGKGVPSLMAFLTCSTKHCLCQVVREANA